MSKVNKFMTGSKLAKKHTLSDQKLAESFGASLKTFALGKPRLDSVIRLETEKFFILIFFF